MGVAVEAKYLDVRFFNILMAGVDYRSAGIEIREKLSFTPAAIRKLLKRLQCDRRVSGTVILSTCNRTEIYFSCTPCEAVMDPVELFCEAAGLKAGDFESLFHVRKGEAAAVYLFELSCGIHSMIYGEDQILSQVKEALRIAQEEKASDAWLNTLFRCAVTCAKQVKTQLVLSAVSPSVATRAVEILDSYLQENRPSKALVIGNGTVGRKVCEELQQRDCEVFTTIRSHKNIETVVPFGCKTIAYDQRQQLIPQVDILVSATSSPHRTVNCSMLTGGSVRTKYVIDLAVPRDIDPEVQNIEGIHYYNIDMLGGAARQDNRREIAVLRTLIDNHMDKLRHWMDYRERIPDGYQMEGR